MGDAATIAPVSSSTRISGTHLAARLTVAGAPGVMVVAQAVGAGLSLTVTLTEEEARKHANLLLALCDVLARNARRK